MFLSNGHLSHEPASRNPSDPSHPNNANSPMKADPHARSYFGRTPLEMAVEQHNIVPMLLPALLSGALIPTG